MHAFMKLLVSKGTGSSWLLSNGCAIINEVSSESEIYENIIYNYIFVHFKKEATVLPIAVFWFSRFPLYTKYVSIIWV